MDFKRVIAIMVVLTVLAMAIARPREARADTEEALILAGIALGAYVGLIVIGTAIVYGRPGKLALTPADLDKRYDQQRSGIRVGSHCAQTATTLTVFCW